MIVSVTMVKNLFTGFPFLKLELFQPLLNDYRFPSCMGALKGNAQKHPYSSVQRQGMITACHSRRAQFSIQMCSSAHLRKKRPRPKDLPYQSRSVVMVAEVFVIPDEEVSD